ncbi:hypothetical protein JVU11DRAFT_10929 [Chiua virens]|nr:hypothetical protein JVU11DRAFT_10929 [Chiua virens]
MAFVIKLVLSFSYIPVGVHVGLLTAVAISLRASLRAHDSWLCTQHRKCQGQVDLAGPARAHRNSVEMRESLQRHEPPQNVYARNLSSHRGYPLWMPELKTQLPQEYQEHGLKIGDVGYVVPERGCFEVLFNICLPLDHDLHQDMQLPRNFQPVTLREADIATYLGEEATGKVIKSTSVTTIEISPEEQPSDYNFTFSSSEGALLVLPQGADQHSLQRDRLFGRYARQHAAEWYRFVEEDLERTISNDSLYLITGFYKARSWALVAFGETEGSENIPAQFKVTQPEGAPIVRGYSWSTTRHSESRVGPEIYNGNANQAIFISGFKIAVRDEPLGRKQIRIKADHPSTKPCCEEFSDTIDSSGLDESGSNKSSSPVHSGHGSSTTHVSIRHMPQVSQPFHPADVINRYLLQKEPSATIAITHDNQWATLLKSAKGELEPHDLADERLVVQALSDKYVVALVNGAVFLRSGKDTNDIESTSDLCQASDAMSAHASRSKTPPLNDDIDSDSSDKNILQKASVPPSDLDILGSYHSLLPAYAITASSTSKTVSPDSVMNTDSILLANQTELSRPMSAPTTVISPNPPVENLTGTSTGGNHDSISSMVECRWIHKIQVCGFALTKENLRRHLVDDHGMKAMSRKTIVQCRWEGCSKRMGPKSLLRHIRETHLGYRRARERKTRDLGEASVKPSVLVTLPVHVEPADHPNIWRYPFGYYGSFGSSHMANLEASEQSMVVSELPVSVFAGQSQAANEPECGTKEDGILYVSAGDSGRCR